MKKRLNVRKRKCKKLREHQKDENERVQKDRNPEQKMCVGKKIQLRGKRNNKRFLKNIYYKTYNESVNDHSRGKQFK